MIVNISKNYQDYVDIFAEAYRLLKEKGFNVDPNKNTFSGLPEYYSHIADLFSLSEYRYVMLPLDEDAFEINLNDRTISVPASFSKCASVQTDLLAETITFVCDRYFDYMDLANTQIFVQWIAANGTHGATQIEMIDLESEPDKIRFAWPLSAKITEKPGTVRFSVRFMRPDSSNQVVYSLNTIDKEITIKPALMPEGPAYVENPLKDKGFKDAIINSNFAGEGISVPLQPTLRDPGADLTINPTNDVNKVDADNNIIDGVKIVSLDNDTVTMYVQAVVADGGTLKYEWYYIPEDSNVARPCIVKDEDGAVLESFGIVEDKFLPANPIDEEGELLPVAERNFPERYYEDEFGLVPYTGEFPAKIPLFTKYSAYTIPAGSGEVTGTYYVDVYNVIESGGKVVTSINPCRSRECLVPGPKDIVIKKDLNATAIITNKVANVKMEVENDPYLPSVAYTWNKSLNADMTDAQTVATTTVPEFNITEPGWYQVHILSALNRKDKEADSVICKVTNAPQPPTVVAKKDADYHLSEGVAKLTVDVIEMSDATLPLSLLSDNIHYIWQMRPVNITDDVWTTIAEDSTAFVGQGTDTLTVNTVEPYGGITFRCLVVNELNGQKAIFDHTGRYTPAEGENFGEFKKEFPYIFDKDSGSNYYYYVFAE